MNPMPDDALDDFLGRPVPRASDELRRTVLEKTTRVVRGQRRRKLLAAVIAVVAACVLFAISGYLLFSGRREPNVVRDEPAPAPSPKPSPIIAPPAPALAADTPAPVLERAGEMGRPEVRAELYRRAGDRYLEESADAEAALRCYTQALDDASRDDLNVSSSDSWLLMALKMDRRKEKRNANVD
jgi:hypothetical protein